MSGAGGSAGGGSAGGGSAGGGERREGVVAAFDEAVGLGRVESTDGRGGSFGFHCTQIAGGSRTIPVGANVTFFPVPGRGGRWEAGDVSPAGGATTE